MNRKALLMVIASTVFSGVTSAQDTSHPMTAYIVADAHLDTQWNWDVQTTIGEYVRNTLEQNLFLLGRYHNYVFNFEGAVKYSWMKEYYPELYAAMKPYVANDRWHLAGSSWDATETIVSSPESWLRNTLLGQTFYREEFGKESTDVFLSDCFGFPYTLPTLAAHCGLLGFSTQKLAWRNNPFFDDGRKYPFNVGLWQGIDGSRIMLAHGFDYTSRYDGSDLSSNKDLTNEISKGSLPVIYHYYGTGDIGGSPTISSVLSVERGLKGSGKVRIISATSDQLYRDFLPYDSHPELPVYDGELLMDVHGTGCYTSQAAMKSYNRQNEHLGDAAERASVSAEWLGTMAYPKQELRENWQRVIVHQFHDDLTGTSIPRAYEFSWNDELLSLTRFSKDLTTAVNGIASRMNTLVSGTPVVLYNAEAFPVHALATVALSNMAESYTLRNDKNQWVRSQVVTDTKGTRSLLVEASVPATGAAVYSMSPLRGKSSIIPERETRTIENTVYRLTLDAHGDISSLVDKRLGKELVAQGQSIGLVVFDDAKSYRWPAWEILKETIDQTPVVVGDNADISLTESGPLRWTLRVKRHYGQSEIIQYIHLYEGALADRIDVDCEVDWQSQHALLKANFPMSFSNPSATYDLGLGSVERGNNKANAYEVPSHEWTDLTAADGSYGVTILNNGKYGWDKPNDNTLRLSLLYTPRTNKSFSYQDRQDLGFHTFTYGIVGHPGQLDKALAVKQSTILNSPIKAFLSERHSGDLERTFSFVSSDNPNVIVRALKKSEVGDDYIVRVYENAGHATQKAKLTFATDIVKAMEANGTEKALGDASFSGRTLNVDIQPFGVKTYRVSLQCQPMAEVASEQVNLPFNRRCFSFNSFRNQADFSGGYSYAAELLPKDGLTVDNVPFKFGPLDEANGLTCHGNVISLPQPAKGVHKAQQYNKLYLLVASTSGDRSVTISAGDKSQQFVIPDYTGFYGQWEHQGHTTGFVKSAEPAYIGSHRHSPVGDGIYEYTYMFKVAVDIPRGATEVRLPDDDHVVVFAATLVDEQPGVIPAGQLFWTNNKEDQATTATTGDRPNLLAQAKVIACSGEANKNEVATNLIDGKDNTKWCDTGAVPNYVDFDLGQTKALAGWYLLSAGAEAPNYITRTCLLQGRNTMDEEWKTIDLIDGNHSNEVSRQFAPVTARYVRLLVIGQTQAISPDATRIYELRVFGPQ